MIQFNLLPDVKLEYIKARRSKRMVMLISGIVALVSFVAFIGLFTVVNLAQPKHINDLNKDIKNKTADLKAIPNLDKILTVQNQLGSLTGLHEEKPVTSKLFDYLVQLTPAQASISNSKLDYTTSVLTLSGSADALSTVNKYVDTLKFTTFTVDGSTVANKAFSNVVLNGFATADKGVTYQLTATFDPLIFSGTKNPKLVVPKIISTRSETEKPTDLFQQATPTVKP